MVVSIILTFADFWFNFISQISGFFIDPLYEYLVNNNWISINYFDNLESFLNDKFIPAIKFSRDVFINITGVPTEFFLLIGTMFVGLIGLSMTFIAVKAILNVYFFIRGGRTLGVFSKK